MDILDFRPACMPAIGDSFAIITGALFTKPGTLVFQITYAGGRGNDVIVTRHRCARP